MGYHVKWVQENLGVSRKALRVFEEEGLMPKNQGRQYREYSEEDIDRIWAIRVFQGMGYSLKEIAAISEDENFDFHQSITEKVQKLEEKKADVERHLGYAQMIKFSGRLPTRPREMGRVKFDDFQEKALDGWNINATPFGSEAKAAFDSLMNLPEDQWGENELGVLLQFLMDMGEQLKNPSLIMTNEVLPRAIIKRVELGADHPEVQLLVKLLFEEMFEADPDVTPRQFGRLGSSSFMEGDIGISNQKRFGVEGCEFIADAIAIFGGFKNYEDSMQY